MLKRSQFPYQQGALDGLCGLYALANAVHYLVGPLRPTEQQTLMGLMYAELERAVPLSSVLWDGVDGPLLSRLLNRVVLPRYPLTRTKPFHRHPRASVAAVWSAVQQCTREGGVAIWGDAEHWTVVYRVTERTWLLLDSYGQRRKRRAALERYERDPANYFPHHLYLLQRSGEGRQ